jgi:hypothetical protein
MLFLQLRVTLLFLSTTIGTTAGTAKRFDLGLSFNLFVLVLFNFMPSFTTKTKCIILLHCVSLPSIPLIYLVFRTLEQTRRDHKQIHNHYYILDYSHLQIWSVTESVRLATEGPAPNPKLRILT